MKTAVDCCYIEICNKYEIAPRSAFGMHQCINASMQVKATKYSMCQSHVQSQQVKQCAKYIKSQQ